MRYQSGALPTSYGYTHQRSDAVSGLDYYGARYYDPLADQFTSADTTLAGGLNRYAYVGGNPETRTDPTGHKYTCLVGGCGGSGNGSRGGGCGTACGGGGAGGSIGALPKGCNYTGYKCQIDSIFKDPNTRKVLMTIANSGSEIGIELLKFMLSAGAAIGGDTYISWTKDPKIPAETLYYSGHIVLNYSLLSADPGNGAANGLIHEAVESYFSIEWGLNAGEMGSQRGDYVAEWFAGEFESQSSPNLGFTPANTYTDGTGGFYKAYGLTFEQWKTTNGFSGFSGEAPSAWNSIWNPHFVPAGWSGVQSVGFHPIQELDVIEPILYGGNPAWFGNPTWV